jgi:anti-sigma B factor antagonist
MAERERPGQGAASGHAGTATTPMPATLSGITVTRRSGELADVVTVAGEIDIATYGQLRAALITAVDDGPGTVIVDMAGVEWIDSTGLGTLVGTLKRARDKGGTVQVAAVPDRIARHFQVTGLARLFGMHPSVEAAKAAVMADENSCPVEAHMQGPGVADARDL